MPTPGAVKVWNHFVSIGFLLLTGLFAHQQIGVAGLNGTSGSITIWVPPLSTRGRWVVDANGNRFKLKSGNWHGGSGTYEGSGDINDDSKHHASENAHTMPLGLQYSHVNDIIDAFESYGLNSIRLQFSNEMIHDMSVIQDAWVAANPQFKGLTPLQVYDAIVAALTARGFAVILNNHTNKSRWCCGVNDGNERWNESQTDDVWQADWLFMVNRYKNNPRVVGADLYNEVRRDLLNDPNWGSADSHDWYRAAQRAAERIHSEANPNLLIIIEGINWYGLPVDGFDHGRPTLEPVGTLSHTLLVSNKLVYSAHFYAYTGPKHSGATGIGETSDLRYRDYSKNDLYDVIRREAGYVALDPDAHYTAPVWNSEFGCVNAGVADVDKNWMINHVNYLIQNDIDFAIWPLVGYLQNGAGNGWALYNWDTALNKASGLYDGGDWRADLWRSLVNSGRTGSIQQPTARYKMVNMDHDIDGVQSLIQRGRGDWDSGATKAMCPDGFRILGLSRSSRRGLCTDATFGDLWTTDKSTTTVWQENHVDTDWASGYTKYQCPVDQYVVGYAMRGAKVSTVLCAKASRALGKSSGVTVWFDQGDNQRELVGGDYASGDWKGSCARDEYVAGVAFTTRIASSGNPAAILCRK
ncbi:glycoside hydrolase superfamily [Crepidotus variabilis]|uniref:Glycoside hydrolase superfamily n=1 Tax=Crepidotus variabilis TaxID=179855 RepID=A0A9P6E6F4_9AGAR|nr:glycoside hydrolase superfamily [Crepidotus variabilis]